MVADVPVTMHFKFQQFSEFLVPLLRNDRCHGFRGSCSFSGAAVERPLALPQLQLVEKSVTFYEPLCIWQSFYCVWCCLWSIGLWIFREVTPGMVSVLNTPRFHSGHIGVSLRGFLEEFHTPLYLAVICTVFGVRLWSMRVWIFWEMTPGMISVLNTPRFHSGYIYGVSLRCLLEEFPSYFNAMLGSTVDTSLCVRIRKLGFLVTVHLALCSLLVFTPMMLGITAGVDQKECYVSPCRKLRISAVAVPRRSSISCCGAEAYSHGLAVQQTIEFPQLLRYMWSMSLLCRLCSFPGGLHFSDMLTTCPLLATTGAWSWTV